MLNVGNGVYEEHTSVTAVPSILSHFVANQEALRITAIVFIPAETNPGKQGTHLSTGFLTIVTEPRLPGTSG